MILQCDAISDSAGAFIRDEEDKKTALSIREEKCQSVFHASSYKANPPTGECITIKHNVDVSGSGEVTFTWGGSGGTTVTGKGDITIKGTDGTSVTLKGSGGTNQENRVQAFVDKDPHPNKNNEKSNGKDK